MIRDLDADNALLRSALDYADRGWRVIPLHDLAGGTCSCGGDCSTKSGGKHPRTAHGLKDGTTDAEQIRAWWTQWPAANVGVVTGAESGIVMLGPDGDEGIRDLADLEERHGHLDSTPTAKSGSGGRHLLFRHPGGIIKNRKNHLSTMIDVRGDGGYFVAAPSANATGRYEWIGSPDQVEVAAMPQWLIEWIRDDGRAIAVPPADDRMPYRPTTGTDAYARAVAYVAAIPPAIAGQRGHDATFAAARACYTGFALDVEQTYQLLCDHYNPRCVPPWSESELRHKAQSAADTPSTHPRGYLLDAPRPDRIAVPSARKRATATPNDAVDDPHRLAGAYLTATADVLRHWRGEWHRWHGGAYRTVSVGDMKARITSHIRAEFVRAGETGPVDDGKGPRSTRKVSTRLVGDTLNALAGMAHIGDAIDAPAWIDGETGPDPAGLIVTRSGILDVAAWADGRPDYLRPLSPALWTPTALPFAFAADAPKPERWLAFLDQLWPDDPASIACLQEWMGYLLTPDTRQQKILFLLGPKRAGKGVITRMITSMVGEENRAGPTLGSLTTNFGLSALLGKTVATISDARLSGRADSAVVVERLLSISGEDALSVDRKHREPITARLSARFVIASNELPRLGDASGALAGRLILLRFTRTFFDTEDSDFERKLQPELPGILLWALDGLRRLRARGRFVQPESGGKLVREMEDLGSPVGAFVREKCVIESGASVPVPELYAEYRRWCEQHGRKDIQNEENFGRDLRAAIPELDRVRRRQGEDRWYAYTPLRLRRVGDLEAEEGQLVPRGRSDLPLIALRKSECEEIGKETEKEWEGRCDLRGPMDLTAPPQPSGPPPSTGRRYGVVNAPGQAKGGRA